MKLEYAERMNQRVRAILRAGGVELTDELYEARFIAVCEAIAKALYEPVNDLSQRRISDIVEVTITAPKSVNVCLTVNGMPLLQEDDDK